jgi:hypothetical protein
MVYAHVQLRYMLVYIYGICSFSVTITFNIMSKFCEQCEQYQNYTLHDVTWNYDGTVYKPVIHTWRNEGTTVNYYQQPYYGLYCQLNNYLYTGWFNLRSQW